MLHLANLKRVFILFCRDMIATGCEDKCVRVYYLATTTDQPLKVFTGNHKLLSRHSPARQVQHSNAGIINTNPSHGGL